MLNLVRQSCLESLCFKIWMVIPSSRGELLVMNLCVWLTHYFRRMSAANMALCVFFAMKNTPLSLVSPVSHAELIIFHRIIGYAAVFLIFLHTIFYTVHLARQGRLSHLLEPSDLAGIGAGIAMFVLLLTGLLRHGRYEWFFVGHIAGFVVVPGLVVLHRPNPAKKLPYVMLFTACLWILDRVIRTTKLSWNSVNNSVTCHPLPGGGTRLLLKKPSIKGAAPGSHCYLWIPRVRFFQLHPFTIVSNGPSGLELIVKPHQGFTKALSDFAMEDPGRTAWVSMDGPYGSLPDTTAYDKLVLVAGGSGAAYTFSLMNRILHLSGRLTSQSIDFAWAVRHTGKFQPKPFISGSVRVFTNERVEHLGWFGEHLRDIQNASPTVNISLHVTNDGRDAVGGEEVVVLPKVDEYERKSETGEAEPLLHASATRKTKDDLKALVAFKKLDAGALVRSRLLGAKSHHRVLIIACGPSSLMNAVRDTADECRWETNCRVDIHCEDFGGS